MAAKCQERLKLCASVVLLLGGWLAPQYVAKALGGELDAFLRTTPLSAALTSQFMYALLLAVPYSPQDGEDYRDVKSIGQPRFSWLLVLPLAMLVTSIHTSWYASMSGTAVSTNTILWNTDVISTPIIAALASREMPSWRVAIAGLLGFVGTLLTVGAPDAENTSAGCVLCLCATTGYGLYAVLVSHGFSPKQMPTTRLLALEGLFSILLCFLMVASSHVLAPELLQWYLARLPSWPWLVFLGVQSLTLNLGWLSCVRLAGASFAAIVSLLSIPFSMTLDIFLLGRCPKPLSVVGAIVVLSGFVFVAHEDAPEGKSSEVLGTWSKKSLSPCEEPWLSKADREGVRYMTA